MDISGIFLLLFVISFFCGILNLFIAFITRKINADYLAKTQNILSKIFIVSNLPIGIIAISINAYNVLRYNEERAGFLICIIIFILSFVSEHLMDKLSLSKKNYEPVHYVPNPVFPAIDLMNNILKQKECILSVINEYSTTLFDNVKNMENNINRTNTVFNDFLYDEKRKKDELGSKMKICNSIFEKLGNSADLAFKNTESLNEKIESSYIAIVSVENHEKMLNDISKTFISIYNDQSMENNVKTQRILDNLANIAYKCANIQDFPKPYKEIIDLYGSKIETVFKVLEKKKFNVLFEKYMQAGKACVYNEPNNAITEINKAIQINPENADAYYYRGTAYRLKKEPDYKAAIKDFEKALELKPNSNLYSKCLEEIKNKYKKDTQE